MNRSAIRLGTRGSDLALWQAECVEDLLSREAPMREVERVIVKTTGDLVQDRPIEAIGRTAVFTAELDLALQEGRVDLAVHSLKDVETRLAAGTVIAAVLPRGPVEDVLVGSRALDELPSGARVGTGSVRRRAQLARLRPDLEIAPVRGNVPTRLDKLAAGEFDALVMARAGLVRLGYAHAIGEVFGPERMLPAVGQGAICVTCREDDEPMRRLLGTLDHRLTADVVRVERALLRGVGGGCNVPLGVSITVRDERFHCTAALFGVGDSVARVEADHPRDRLPEEVGEALAAALFAAGAEGILRDLGGTAS
ncbi:MAG: hydroxymethylbilane synthase [Planctomycetota bacterium]